MSEKVSVAAVREVVECFKEIKGFAGDKKWDKAHFPRNAKSAQQLLMYLDSASAAKQCIKDIADQMKKRGLDWTLETVFRHSDEWRAKYRPKDILKEDEDKWARIKHL